MGKLSAALISLGSVSSKATAAAMAKYFDSVDELDIRKIEVHMGDLLQVLHDGEPIKEYDCIYAKGSFKYVDILRSIASLLQDKCYMPIHDSAFTVGHDKLLTHLCLAANNVSTPKTYFMATTDGAKNHLKTMNFPIVMKFPKGTHGKGVMFADSFESAISMLDALAALNQPFIVQEYIETGGIDIRAFVVGNKVIAAMQREAMQGEKRANIHAGGKGKAITLDWATAKIATDTAKALQCDICAVDILKGASKSFVIEANLSPGLQGITAASKIDVVDKIAKFLFDQTQKRKSKTPTKTTADVLKELGIKRTEAEQELMTTLDFRGPRIVLPEMVTQICDFDEKTDVVLKVKAGRLIIQKLDLGS